MFPRLTSTRLAPIAAAAFAALIVGLAVLFVDAGERDRARRQHRAEVQHQASEVRAKLEQALAARLHLAQGLAAYVTANPSLDQQALDAYARSLFTVQPGIRYVALAQGTTIVYVYPYAENAELIGLDLTTQPTQRESVGRALQGRQFVLAGPVELAKETYGLVARHPVILPYEDPGPGTVSRVTGPSVLTSGGQAGPQGMVWGLSLVVFNHLSLFGAAGMLDTTTQTPLLWALRGVDGWGAAGELFYGPKELFDADPVLLDVALPTGSWQLAAAPKGGWQTTTPTLLWIRTSGGVLALLLALVVYSLVRDPVRLREAVERATANAVENARLYEAERQRAERATVEERQRLARELHDSVTQTLFSASLIAEVLPRLWQRSPDVALPRLEELRQLTSGALAEMRTLLLELRPAVLIEMPLEDLLRQLGEAIAGRARLPVSVDVEGTHADRLPPDVQIALYRIAQEAVNNAAKHSGASHAFIALHWLADADGALSGVQLRIRDDGRGFDPATVPAGHLGIAGMRERATGISATLLLHSAPGEGTHVTVEWSRAAVLADGEHSQDAPASTITSAQPAETGHLASPESNQVPEAVPPAV